MSARVYKLITGEDIVGTVLTSEDPDFLVLKDVAKFIVTERGIGMIPFFPFSASDTIKLSVSNILCDGEIAPEIYNAYSSQFGSGLVLAGADIKEAAKSIKISK